MSIKQWQRTLISLHREIKTMDGWEKLFTRSWCLMLVDAIDGPMYGDPGSDIEGKHAGRKTAREYILDRHEDFEYRCNNIGLNVDAISEYFRDGHITRKEIEGVFKAVRPDDIYGNTIVDI